MRLYLVFHDPTLSLSQTIVYDKSGVIVLASQVENVTSSNSKSLIVLHHIAS